MAIALCTAAAERDIEEIGYQIAVRGGRPATARKILSQLIVQCNKLAELASSAQLGTAAPEIGEGVRLFPFKRWMILFRYRGEDIVVLRIADGSQDYFSWRE